MKQRINHDRVRRKLSDGLLSLERILAQNVPETVVNSEVLKSSANAVITATGKQEWHCVVTALRLRVEVPRNSIPDNCGKHLNVECNMSLKSAFGTDALGDIKELVLNISVETESKTNICAWHLDRHFDTQPNGQPSHDAHPLYHFQHGGHAMKPHTTDLGKALLLATPRLASPPMDAILSIDFVISNFAGKAWHTLRSNSEYNRLLKDSQQQYWKPYFEHLSSWWPLTEQSRPDTHPARKLWPQLN